MKNSVIPFISALTIFVGCVALVEMYLVVQGIQLESVSVILPAFVLTSKWFIYVFNGAAILFILPFFAGTKRVVSFYNKTAGNEILWGAVEGFSYLYIVIWLLWLFMPLCVPLGLDKFYTHDFMTGMVTYHLPLFGEYTMTSHEWDYMWIIGFAGILGAKATILMITWASTLRHEEFVTFGGMYRPMSHFRKN